MKKKPLALIILDGYGLREEARGNAILAANTPVMDGLLARWPHTQLGASGMDVGLPEGQMGNSEVGHTNIGAGRIVYQELTRITKSIIDGDFYENPALLGAVRHCKETGGALHLMGLLSDGGVHSHLEHLLGLLRLCRAQGLERVYVHGFLDGRDVPPTSGAGFVRQLLAEMNRIGVGRLATLSGRYYAMDRDNRWERVELAYDAMTLSEGHTLSDGPAVRSPVELVEQSYRDGVTDEFLLPTVLDEEGRIQNGDGIVFYNFRPDRARQLTRAFVDKNFNGFVRKGGEISVYYVCMTQYDSTIEGVEIAFPPTGLSHTLGQVLSEAGRTQLRIAETEKYAHVTFFLNGGKEEVYPGEDRALIPSPKVATYDLAPAMSAGEVTGEVLRRLDTVSYDVVILNYANCDMVGHTGSFPAAVAAVETVDSCLGRVVDKILEMEGIAIVTADHGNADQMFAEDGSPFTAHTLSRVPLVMAGWQGRLAPGVLADIAPTMLTLLGLPIPPEMTGKPLVCDNL